MCVGGRTGSQGHWSEDAATFAEWGVDWVKMDWCGGASDVRGSYANMSKALNESGRHIALNMCRGDERPWGYIDAYAQSWRVTEDHSGKWSQPSHGIKQGIATAMQIPRNATGKPYGWNGTCKQLLSAAGRSVMQCTKAPAAAASPRDSFGSC